MQNKNTMKTHCAFVMYKFTPPSLLFFDELTLPMYGASFGNPEVVVIEPEVATLSSFSIVMLEFSLT